MRTSRMLVLLGAALLALTTARCNCVDVGMPCFIPEETDCSGEFLLVCRLELGSADSNVWMKDECSYRCTSPNFCQRGYCHCAGTAKCCVECQPGITSGTKACGDRCIQQGATCNDPPGCACDV